MSSQLMRSQIGQGVHFSAVRDPKFKMGRLSVNFILPLERETASDNAVVPFLLRKGFRECPDFTSLNQRLAELYGATLDADVTKYGGWQVLELSIKALDNRYALEGEDLTGRCADLLACAALDPNLTGDGLFPEREVELERQFVLDSIDAEINDKRSYALSRCIQTMCAGEPVAYRRFGERETAAAITPASAAAAWRRMVREAGVEIVFTGPGDGTAASRLFADRFAALERAPGDFPPVKLRTSADAVREETEHMEVSQSKLVMGMRTGQAPTKEAVAARRLFAALYGGTPFSKLFMNVREKLSLCYYCAARYDVATGLLLVDSGVEAANKQLAHDEILRQLEAVQQGSFTDEELRNTKLLMKNSVTTIKDTLSGLEGWYLSQILRGQQDSPEEDAARLESITREEVVQAAQAVTLDTVYFLTGNNTGEDA